MTSFLERFADHIRGLRAPRTVIAYRRIAGAFLASLGDSEREPPSSDVERFLGRPRKDGEPRCASTRNQELAALRALASLARTDGRWTQNPTEGLHFAKESRKDPVFLTSAELAKLFAVAASENDQTRRARNIAIVALLSQLGLRVHELVALESAQVDVGSMTLLGVHGKGGTRVDLPMSARVTRLLEAWLLARKSVVGVGEPALFVAGRGCRLSVRSVQRLIDALWSRCGSPKHATCHSLRHTTATLSITLGTDVAAVGDLLRHGSLDVTRRYIGMVGERRRAAVDRLGATIPASVLTPGESSPALAASAGASAVVPVHRPPSQTDPVDVHDELDDAA
jgi:site-specific recombinase XerD